ncbi:MAG TPA: aminomethyl-transferring glycine dehydrogenase subunit GcvPB, partial [Gammaproteobacteria bacterium]|nr:aminomethyl-transferring glycine dehydrogenase subunit GcvPB [Gammaproteobacteria bacterium]
MLIFDQSRPGRQGVTPATAPSEALSGLPINLRRTKPAPLPEVSELQAVRHYTRLSQKNFSIDT